MNNIQEEISNAEQAIIITNSNTNTQSREKANQYLVNLQSHLMAWEILPKLVVSKNTQVQFFSSNMLYKKLRIDWDTLDNEKKLLVKKMMLNMLKYLTEDENTSIHVIQRICMTIGALAVRLITEGSSEIVKELIESIPVTHQKTRYCLVHILCSSVEELEPFGVDRGRKAAASLLESSQMVLQLLKMIITKQSEGNEQMEVLIKKKSVECLSQWISLGIDIDTLLSMEYIDFLLLLLKIPYLFSETVDAINFLFSGPHTFNSIDYPLQGRLLFERENHQKSIHSILYATLQLETLYDKLSSEENKENEKIVESIAKLVVGIVEFNPHMLVNIQSEHIYGLLKFLLKCTTNSNHNISYRTLSMWTNFVSLLHQYRNQMGSYENFLSQLLNVLIKMGCYPKDFSGWDESDLDDENFEEFREKLKMVMTRLSSLLKEKFFMFFAKLLSEQHEWNVYEGIVNAISAGNNEVSKLDNQIMPNIFSMILKLPFHPILSSSVAICFSNFGRWFRNHSDMVPLGVNYIVKVLESNHKDIPRMYVAEALQRICKDTREHLSSSFTGILSTFKNYLNLVGDDKDLNESAGLVLEALIFCLPYIDVNLTKETLQFIVGTLFSFLDNVNLTNYFNCERKTKGYLELVSITFNFSNRNNLEYLKERENPFFLAFNYVFPKYKSLLENLKYEKMVSENFCDFISYSAQSGGDLFSSFLLTISQILYMIFKETKVSKSLFTNAELLSLYHEQIPELFNLLKLFIQQTFQIIQTDLESNHDIAKAFFDTMIQPLFYFPEQFLNSELLNNTFMVLIPSIPSQDSECVASLYRYSVQFWCEKKENIWQGVREKAFIEFGEKLITALFKAIIGTSNRQIINYYAELIYTITKINTIPKNTFQSIFFPLINNLGNNINENHKNLILNVLINCEKKLVVFNFLSCLSDVINLKQTSDRLLDYANKI